MKKKALKIRIKYFDRNMPRLEKIAKGDWIDLRSREELTYEAGDTVKLMLGIAMELPDNYEAYILPRSSTLKHFGLILANSMGLVDEIFKGDNDEWFASLYALRDGHINKHDRVVQFRIEEKMPELEFEEVEVLGNKDRGGHGSTGVK